MWFTLYFEMAEYDRKQSYRMDERSKTKNMMVQEIVWIREVVANFLYCVKPARHGYFLWWRAERFRSQPQAFVFVKVLDV